MPWFPHVTVAAVVEQEGRFLLVREQINGRSVINQPAGHWEENESLIDAVVRETLEETGWDVEPLALLDIAQYRASNGMTFLRNNFVARAIAQRPNFQTDPEIEAVLWLSRDELFAQRESLRSPMVLNAIDTYLSGQRFPLNVFADALS